jgi:hypothetical protein
MYVASNGRMNNEWEGYREKALTLRYDRSIYLKRLEGTMKNSARIATLQLGIEPATSRKRRWKANHSAAKFDLSHIRNVSKVPLNVEERMSR